MVALPEETGAEIAGAPSGLTETSHVGEPENASGGARFRTWLSVSPVGVKVIVVEVGSLASLQQGDPVLNSPLYGMEACIAFGFTIVNNWMALPRRSEVDFSLQQE